MSHPQKIIILQVGLFIIVRLGGPQINKKSDSTDALTIIFLLVNQMFVYYL